MLRQMLTMTLVLVAACGDSTGPSKTGGGATLAGTVRAAGQSIALAGATVSVGTLKATSDEQGHFELTNVPVGSATVRAERPGYEPAEATVKIVAGSNTHDFGLTAQEFYQLGAISAYVPAGVEPIRGAIIALGGPNTGGFVDGQKISSADDPVLEQALQELGTSLRALARSRRFALLGTKNTGMPNSSASDDALLSAVRNAGEKSGHPELIEAPILMFGLSSGGPEAAGMAARHAERAVGLLLRVPVGVVSLNSAAALAIPTFVMQAGRDDPQMNLRVKDGFLTNRARGGLWSLAVEPDVIHAQATERANGTCIAWLSQVLAMRLPSTPGAALNVLQEDAGWLGDQSTLSIAAWGDYAGDRTAASWLLNEATASSWKLLATPVSGGGGGGTGD